MLRYLWSRRGLAAALGAALLAIGLPAVAAVSDESSQKEQHQAAGQVTALAPVCSVLGTINNSGTQKVITANTGSSYSTADAWDNVACGSSTVAVPRGKSATVVVDVSGSVLCYNVDTSDSGWCKGRVLINGVPGAPAGGFEAWAPVDSDFANEWAGGFSRAATLTCPASHPEIKCTYPFVVQANTFSTDRTFFVDDLTVVAQAFFAG